MSQLRPISLCNVLYKIIAKVLTMRLRRVIMAVINPNQSTIVQGRQIHDNILVVHEILHSLKQGVDGVEGSMAIKLDMAKTYDRVEWPFLLEVMLKLAFHPKFCDWIRECISTVSYSVLMNGVPSGYILPTRGLRQGDLMSPFLFLLCAEALSSYICKHELDGLIHGMRVSVEAEPISHLFFADDSVIFYQANEYEASQVMRI